MDLQQRSFALVAIVAAAVAAPALGQSGSAQTIPDFSGIWAHANPGFEPLKSGPTSIVNRIRRPNGTGDILNLTGDHTNPILRPHAAAAVQKHAEYHARDEGDPNPRNQCHLEGPPFVFTNGPTRIVQSKDTVKILYQYNHQVRHVRMNAQLPARVTPTAYGHSVGRYEGDTLVVETVGIKLGKYSMVDWYGTPRTEAIRVVERYRMLSYEEAKEGFERDAKEHNVADGRPVANANGKYLQLSFTVEDPNTFTTPWTATMTYRNVTGNDVDWVESVCAENIQWFPGKDSDVPRSEKPDF